MTAPAHLEPGRVQEPTDTGTVDSGGVRIAYEVFGDGERTVMLLPTWSIVPSRMWKLQVPFLSRHFRVVTFDGRGSGASDRPSGALAYAVDAFARDVIAVMDATGTSSATLVAHSCGTLWAVVAAAEHPDRIDALASICPAVALAPGHPERAVHSFEEPLDTEEGWAKYNRHYWERAYPEFVAYFAGECLSERHCAKPIEDFIEWGLSTTPAVLVDATRGTELAGATPWPDQCARVRCPVLVLHGDEDHIRPLAQGAALAHATDGQLVVLRGTGHLPHVRHPVRVNLLLYDFIASLRRR